MRHVQDFLALSAEGYYKVNLQRDSENCTTADNKAIQQKNIRLRDVDIIL